ncbi:Na+/H+ antiporter [Paenilisteria rocourtiae]|uniref:Sodium/proton antiporter (CPA1 family) n=1 Tax=Listeria rocourtiae TaxID=647910 RepID=A0A4R6ZRY6_9LIST|nr:Na+/H+ antiporter [Listeria rocourtiae]MBC1434542.1 Na+/H+ antiporter [Listeria rocourtiae]MBC1603234.1 Na+/H+ antiporter [Listeria rocourtiae]TDR55483.1 sodium/proton antiporter (CPA1 family) [Listeria rocourtiae]
MEIFYYVLIMLAAILISNVVNRFIPFVSIPLIQIGLGVIVAVLPLAFELKLNPELFLVLFIAPLLFNDGKRTDRQALWNLRAPILMLALGLVFVTVLVIGYFVNWMIPTIPLAAAFALAAALAPTDAVAVGSLSGRIDLPKKITHLLEGEALMNDASGLVAFQFAIAAMVTGVFSIWNASVSFIVIAVGGIICGLALTFIKFRFLKWIRKLGMEDVTLHMLIQILTPFVIYLVAEELHVSGILAVVAAGIMHAFEKRKMDPMTVKLNVVSQGTWSVIIFVLNGLVFIILGTQLPDIIQVVWQNSGVSNWQVVGYVLLITFSLIGIRFLWIHLSWLIPQLMKGKDSSKPNMRATVLTSLSGVRGAVTLASALSIPFVLADGSPFPQRSLIICIASGVILCSLIIATAILPILARKDESKSDSPRAEKSMKLSVCRHVVEQLSKEITSENKVATQVVMDDYRGRMRAIQKEDIDMSRQREIDKEQQALRLQIVQWEKENTDLLVSQGEAGKQAASRYHNYLDSMEKALSGRGKSRSGLMRMMFKRLTRQVLHPKQWQKAKVRMDEIKQNKEQYEAMFQEIRDLREKNASVVKAKLVDMLDETNQAVIWPLINENKRILEQLKQDRGSIKSRESFEQAKKDVQLQAIQIERDVIQNLFEQGKISRDLTRELRQNLNLYETYYFGSEELA